MAPVMMTKAYQAQLEVVPKLEKELQDNEEACADPERDLRRITNAIEANRAVASSSSSSTHAAGTARINNIPKFKESDDVDRRRQQLSSIITDLKKKVDAAKAELRRLGIAEGIINAREVAPVSSKSSTATKKNPSRAAKTQTLQGPSAPKGIGKRKTSAAESQDDAPKKKAKTGKTAAPRPALQEKSTNDNVTAPRERGRATNKEKMRKRAASSSPSPEPVRPKRQKVVKGVSNRTPVSEPKCASSAAKSAGKGSTTPAAKTTSGTAPLTKGTKRTAAFNVGDTVPPQAKKAELLSKKPGTKSSSETGADVASEKTSGLESTESSAGGSSTDDITSDTTSATPPSSDDANIAGTPPAAGVQKQRPGFKGIRNIGSSCFSAAVIQLLDAALAGRNLDRILGTPKTVDDPRLLNDEQCKNIETGFSLTPIGKRQDVGRMRTAIQGLVVTKAWDKVSVASHLRHVLEKLHTDNGETEISTLRFQSIIAGSKPLLACMNGDTQQDASQYFDIMLEALENDLRLRELPNKGNLIGLLQIHTQANFECPDEQCRYKWEPAAGAKVDKTNQHNVPIPKGSECSSFRELLAKSMHGETDIDCKSCGKTKLVASTYLTNEPDNFVVKMGRNHAGFQYRKDGKASDLIDLSDQVIEFDGPGMKYALSAAIMHRGPTVTKGHYIIFRKNGDDWYKIDDIRVSKVDAKDVTDTSRFGQSAMLLFQKQQA